MHCESIVSCPSHKHQITHQGAQLSHPQSFSLDMEMEFCTRLPVNSATFKVISASERK